MRAKALGLMVAVGIAWSIVSDGDTIQRAYAQRFDGTNSSGNQQAVVGDGGLMVVSAGSSGNQQTLVLVDPQTRRLASYQVDLSTQKVSLRSVRNIRWDLEIDEFNGTEPTPERIRALLQSR